MNDEYEAGLRDGKIKSLESIVASLTLDVKRLSMATYALYGAIALVQILPEIRGMIGG